MTGAARTTAAPRTNGAAANPSIAPASPGKVAMGATLSGWQLTVAVEMPTPGKFEIEVNITPGAAQ